jgi:hypothetical protein
MEILTSSLENQSEIKHQIEFISEPEVIIKAEVARLRWYIDNYKTYVLAVGIILFCLYLKKLKII